MTTTHSIPTFFRDLFFYLSLLLYAKIIYRLLIFGAVVHLGRRVTIECLRLFFSSLNSVGKIVVTEDLPLCAYSLKLKTLNIVSLLLIVENTHGTVSSRHDRDTPHLFPEGTRPNLE